MRVKDVKKVVLAYSGGLDTSVILKWLQQSYGCEVVTFTADLGQGEELGPARKKAEAAGVKEIFIEDLREEFVRDFVFPMMRANARYEGDYLLGTSIARPPDRSWRLPAPRARTDAGRAVASSREPATSTVVVRAAVHAARVKASAPPSSTRSGRTTRS